MPSYDQLDNEAAWRDEFAPPALATLAAGLRAHWPGAGVWIRGDNAHMRGYHRSRRWVKNSIYCTDRTYSVSRTAGDRSGGNENWACALDLGGIPQSELHAACRRLDEAVRAGLLEKITEWYGNFGGDDRVDGYDNIANRLASADSSHLTHLHLSFDRGRAGEDHSDLLAILTGGLLVATEDDVKAIWRYYLAPNGYNMQDHLLNTESAAFQTRDELRAFVAAEQTRDAAMLAAIQALAAGGGVDAAPIIEAVRAQGEATRALIVEQLNREHAAEVAELRAALAAREAAAGS